MSHEDIIRAWKDEDYRMSLSEEERAKLPENPAGLIELTDSELELVGGGYDGGDSNFKPGDTELGICDCITQPCCYGTNNEPDPIPGGSDYICPPTPHGPCPQPDPENYW